ncbi:MAG: hypothetical protein DRP95_00925 [Candidatus Latescibacterota bacterium]|nr:MAG: hypothetical protein DRP95_00925 [Candidatus Latescibacterota bacterium]
MMRKIMPMLSVFAVVAFLAGAAGAHSIRFVWKVDPGIGLPAISLDYCIMNEGEAFKWQDVEIPLVYQAFADYWQALGSSSVTVQDGAIDRDITIVITLSPGRSEMFGHPVALQIQFDVYDGIEDGTEVKDLTLLNPPGTHFSFNRPDGLVLYFEFSPAFEAAFLEPIGLSRDQITLAFVEGYQFVREGIDVTPIWDGDALTGLIGKVSHLSTIVLVDKKAVQPTDVETSTWAKIKALWR